MNSENKQTHTPGPWEVEGDDGLIMSSEGIAVANVLYPEDFPYVEDAEGVEHECQANARLIAAAPDMLAALKSANAMIDFMSRAALEAGLAGTSQWDRVAGGADMYGTQDEIRTALAQARKEQP